jgi:hypothetical protein
MKKINRRSLFKNTALGLVASTLSMNVLAGEKACKTAKKKLSNKKFEGVSDEYIKKGKLGYKEVAPAGKAKKGKNCGNCKHFCEENNICTLASMAIKKDKKKYYPKAHTEGYCNMFAWDNKKKKEWKKNKKS